MGGPVDTSYSSTTQILEREARALQEVVRRAPGARRRFAVRRSLVTLVVVALWVWFALDQGASTPAVLVTVLAALLAMGVLTVWDVRRWSGRELDEIRSRITTGCPPGTEVRGTWTPESVTFRLPWDVLVVEWSTVTRAEVRHDVLLLFHDPHVQPWAVPGEMVGPDVLALVRGALGDRFEQTPG